MNPDAESREPARDLHPVPEPTAEPGSAPDAEPDPLALDPLSPFAAPDHRWFRPAHGRG